MKLVFTQLRMELATLMRNYEQLLLIVVIPIGVLVFFGNVSVLPDGVTLSKLLSSVVTLSIMSTAMVSTGIATGFERSYHVLKRLGATPLGRGRLIAAKAAAVAVVELMQIIVVVIIAIVMGWSTSDASWWRLVIAVVLGTASFAGIGLFLAGRLRAETNLAAQNGLFLVLLAIGGVMVPVDELPTQLGAAAAWLPSGALAEVMHAALAGSQHMASDGANAWLVLLGWAVVAPTVAARFFRFDG